jgi:hypothetical protein
MHLFQMCYKSVEIKTNTFMLAKDFQQFYKRKKVSIYLLFYLTPLVYMLVGK